MKTFKIKLSLAFVLFTVVSYAQIGIGASTPKESSVLELYSDDKALLLTRVDNESKITNPINGMIDYDKDLNYFRGMANDLWLNLGGYTGSTPPSSLPNNVTLKAGLITFIASVNYDGYIPYTVPTGSAEVGIENVGGSTETLIDIQV